MVWYWASVSAMAARLPPNRSVAINCASRVLLAATWAGVTIVDWAWLNAAAAACAAVANCWHCAAVVRNQVRYGATASLIAAEDGPFHSCVSVDTTEV